MKKQIFIAFCLPVLFGLAVKSEAQSVVINEALSSNSSYDYDDFFQYEDWIELYNDGGILNLSGYYLSDDPDTLDKWMFPSSNPGLTTILPGGHLRIWCDNDEQQGEDHTNFKLSSNGESLVLRSPDGFTIADSVHFGVSQPDQSYARVPNGSGPFEWTSEVTPEACNDCEDSVFESCRVVSALYHGANPLRSGERFTLFDDAKLMDSRGVILATFKSGLAMMPHCLPGVYILQGNGGEVMRLVVAAH